MTMTPGYPEGDRHAGRVRSDRTFGFIRSLGVRIPCSFGIILLLASPLSAHTKARYYRGDIAVPTSWDGVIRLTGTVVIREGVTVTVDPGTEVLIQPGVGTDIVVRGRLLVRGLPGKPVLFDSAGGCGEGPWGGIVFERGSSGRMENVRVRCSSRGIEGDRHDVILTDVLLH